MSSLQAEPVVAAKHLLAELKAPPGAISISTFPKQGGGSMLRVFIKSGYSYLKSRVPSSWEGFSVQCEIADTPKAC